VSVLPTAIAANRRIVLARLFTLRVRRLNTFPPLIFEAGHNPNQEQNARALRHRLMSVPISPMSIRTLNSAHSDDFGQAIRNYRTAIR
jgi:hypothetical protein